MAAETSIPVAVITARQTIRVLFAKYDVQDAAHAHEQIRERFSQEDYEIYREALETLFRTGDI